MSRMIAALVLGLSLAGPAAHAQTLTLTQPPPLAKGMPALPRIATPVTPATTKINAALAKVDASWRDFTKSCNDQVGATDADVERSNQVAMAGSGYFSVKIGYSYYCGGAHPEVGDIALTYSLDTGTPVNWSRLLPKSLIDSVSTDNAGDGTIIGLVTSKTLQKIYAREALVGRKGDDRKDCADVYSQGGLTFQVWLDAKAGAVMLVPNLAHVVAACGDPRPISVQTLRKLGVAAPLLIAIEAAHAAAH